MTVDTDQKSGLGKVCTKCGEWKLLEEFYRDNANKSGRRPECVNCSKRIKINASAKKTKQRKVTKFWTDQRILAEAKKYGTRSEFMKGNRSAYFAGVNSDKGIGYFCEHMSYVNEVWTFEKIMERALIYQTIRDFRVGDLAAYTAGLRSGRKDEIYAHMKMHTSSVQRYVYTIKSADGRSAYVGLSVDPMRRYADHKRNGTKDVKQLLSGEHEFDVIAGPIAEDDAARLEASEIDRLKAEGKRVINSVKAGGLGWIGEPKWTRDTIAREALKYSSKAEFYRGSQAASAAAARRFGGVDQFCGHMKPLLKKWDVDSIRKEALKYTSRSSFEKGCGSAVSAARRLGIMDEVCSHMVPRRRRLNDKPQDQLAA